MLELLSLKPETFGLDLSDLSLKIIKLGRRGKFLGLASFGETEIQPGIIKSGEIKDEGRLAEVIKEAVGKVRGEKLKTRHIIASLPEEKAFLRVIQMPVMEEREIKKAVYFEAENYIPLPLEKVYLDSQLIPSSGRNLTHSEVLIVALPREIVDSYLSLFQRAGLRPVAFEMEAQAVSRALIKRNEENRSLLLVDMGATKTGLAFFARHSLRFTASLPIVSDRFAKEELAKEIKKHIAYYQTFEVEPLAEVLLCGGGANSQELFEFLCRELAPKVSVGNPWINIFPDSPEEIPEVSFGDSLKYTTALGLALYDKPAAKRI